jgi:S-ribosylhomocysteine lyase
VNQPRMNVESFNLDHRTVVAPYVRLADTKALPQGDVIVKYDVRFTQPNAAHLDMPAVHSIEHLFAEHSRNHSERVIDFSPMGCQTGFYLILQGEPAFDEVVGLIESTMTDILGAAEVPAANEVQCGWGANHSLTAAQEAVTGFLAGRAGWANVTA